VYLLYDEIESIEEVWGHESNWNNNRLNKSKWKA
jgi:hypothetical protein